MIHIWSDNNIFQMAEFKLIPVVRWIGWIDLTLIVLSSIILVGISASHIPSTFFTGYRDRVEFGNLKFLLGIILGLKFAAAVTLIYGTNVGIKHPSRALTSTIFWLVIDILHLILCCVSFTWILSYPYLVVLLAVGIVVYLIFTLFVGALFLKSLDGGGGKATTFRSEL